MSQNLSSEELKNLILQFAASITLADDLADVSSSLMRLLQMIGFKDEFLDFDKLYETLARMGVSTLEGVELDVEDREYDG